MVIVKPIKCHKKGRRILELAALVQKRFEGPIEATNKKRACKVSCV